MVSEKAPAGKPAIQTSNRAQIGADRRRSAEITADQRFSVTWSAINHY